MVQIGVALASMAGALLTKLGGWSVLGWIAFRLLLKGAITVGLMVALWNLGLEFLDVAVTWALDQVVTTSTGSGSTVLALTGLAGWFANLLRVPECVTFVVSALTCKLALRLVSSLTPLRVVK